MAAILIFKMAATWSFLKTYNLTYECPRTLLFDENIHMMIFNTKRYKKHKPKLLGEHWDWWPFCQIPRSDHIRPSLDQPHWLPILDCVIYKTVLHVFKSLHWLSLLNIDSCLKTRSLLSSVTTRSSNYIFLEVLRSMKLAFCVSAPKVWNNLPNTIKDASGLDTFKLNWNDIYIHVIMSFPILYCSVCIFWYSFLFFFVLSFLYCILRFACILRKRRFINFDIVLYCIIAW